MGRDPTLPSDFDSTLIPSSPSKFGGTAGSQKPQSEHESTMSGTQSLNRRVLRYYGYYEESVPESAIEKHRVRRIVVQYFLEDDTMSVSEPRQDNSGISTQGTMVKRHQIPRQNGDGCITYADLGVGQTVTFYGRDFHLVDCDRFTREFMSNLGVEMPEAIPYPVDDYEARNSKPRPAKLESVATTINASGMKVKLSQSEIRATKQFLQNDRKVLRFGAMWDDTKALYGRKHFFTLYYFLSEDSIELVEKNENNSGRDPFPSFIRRQKIVKPRDRNSKAIAGADLTFSKGKDLGVQYYTDADLRIGSSVIVYGRELLIHSYDKFTQDYFRDKYGITEYNPIDVSEPEAPRPKRIPPPYNGYGDEEDSLASWRSLDIRPPRKDETNWLKYGDNVVKYALKLDNGIATDSIRKFVLSCFLADSTISIFEPVQRNSGIVGGKFLQRTKVKNPETDKLFVAQDFWVGRHVNINGYPFVVYATDERSLSYMEQNSHSFAMSNVNRIINKLTAMLQSSQTGLADAFHDADAAGTGHVDYKEMLRIFSSKGLDVSEQEVLTLLRYFDRNGEASISYEELISRILPEGSVVGRDSRAWETIFRSNVSADEENFSIKDVEDRKRNASVGSAASAAARAFLEVYEQRRQLVHSLFRFQCDYSTDSKLGEPEFRVVLREKMQLPISDDQLNALCERFFPKGHQRVEYEEIIRLLNGSSTLEHNMYALKRSK